jgi:N-acetylmuramoyl-L-alanine amidase
MKRKPTPTAFLTLLVAALLILTFTFSCNDVQSSSQEPAQPTAAPGGATAGGNTTQPPAAAPVLPLKGKKIVLDPGHGGTDPGAVRGEVEEAQLTLAIALKLKKLLEAQGAKVVLTRADDSDKELNERTDLSNHERPNIFVSIHINASNNSKADGIETYYYTAQSRVLAKCLFEEMVATLGAKANWVHQRSLYVCRLTDAPAVLVEVGYISNKVKREKLTTSQYQDLIAEALEKGIIKYFSPKSQAHS